MPKLLPVHNVPPLSPQEATVLSLMWEGLSYKEIAHAMELSVKTVKNYIHNLYEKLHVATNVQAVRRAVDLGLLQPAPVVERGDWP